MKRSRATTFFVVTLLFGAVTFPAHADDKAACIGRFEKATELRAASHYVEARQLLLACGGATCPADVQQECAKELQTLDASMPTIVLVTRDQQGRDRVSGRALVDGTAVALDGRAVPLDPGPHTIRFEVQGCTPTQEDVLVVEGERHRAIAARLSCPDLLTSDVASASPAPTKRRSYVLPIALGALGVVGISSFAILGATGKSDLESIRDTGCAPTCNRDEVMSARTKLLIGDVFGLVGLVSLGAAAWLTFAPNETPTR